MHPTASLENVCRRGERILERAEPLFLILLSVLFFGLTGAAAAKRLFWYDELFTLELAKLPGAVSIWDELAVGRDTQPPLIYWVTHAMMRLGGDEPWILRVPGMVGFWVMLVAMYLFLRRWCPPLFALAAVLIPIATSAYTNHALEARPYGMLLGLAGLALLCWQSAARSQRRLWSLFGLALSLAGALLTHYYGVLLWIPLVLGECVRVAERRRIDLPMVLALGLPTLTLVVLWPLISSIRGFSGGFAGRPTWDRVVDFYQVLLDLRFLPVLAILGFLVIWPRLLRSENAAPPNTEGPAAPPLSELTAVVALALLPLFAVALARTVTNAYHHRYAVPAIVGVTILLVFAVYRHARGSAVVGCWLLLVTTGWVAVREHRFFDELDRKSAAQASLLARLQERSADNLPIAVLNATDFLPLVHYAPPELAQRLVYVHSQELSMRILGYSTNEMALERLQLISRLRMAQYADFVRSQRRFYLFGYSKSWLLPALLADGADVRVELPELYLAEIPAAAANDFRAEAAPADRDAAP
jgi:hypothetical protein